MKLADIFCDHAVFQRDKEIAVFGSGKGKISVNFCGTTTEYVSETDSFLFYLPSQKAGGPYEMNIDLNGDKLTLCDIMIGDVIYCGGQSNMEFRLQFAKSANEACDNSALRLYHAKQISTVHKYENEWNVLTKKSAGEWSAIGFHIAKILNEKRGVPIGIIQCAQGASVIQSHMPPELVHAFDFAGDKCHPDRYLNTPEYNFEIFNHPSDIYNFMIKPLEGYSISAICWYQGESNTAPYESAHYDSMMKALFIKFRHMFNDEKLPIVAVQINDYNTPYSMEGWKRVQLAQLRAANELIICETVTISDLGEHSEIHPLNKKTVAERICKKLEAMR